MRLRDEQEHLIDILEFGREPILICSCAEILEATNNEALAEAFRLHRKRHGLTSGTYTHLHATEFNSGVAYDFDGGEPWQ